MRRTRWLAAASAMLTALTMGAAPPADGTTPGRDGLILFSADTGSGYQIYTVRPDGRDLRQITQVSGDATNGDWSPDGRRIAFEIDTIDPVEKAVIAVMDADGTNVVELPGPPGVFQGEPAFTADGQGLIFSTYDPATNVSGIYRMDLQGGDRTFITDGGGAAPAGLADPNVSPDGTRISFLAGQGEHLNALAVADADGGNQRLLTPYETEVAFKHDWAPDGRHLVFSNNADDLDEAANIATIRPDGTGLRYLTHFIDPEQRADVGSYSPSGRAIVLRVEDHGAFGLFTISPRGGRLRQVLGFSDFKPRFIDWGAARCGGHGDA